MSSTKNLSIRNRRKPPNPAAKTPKNSHTSAKAIERQKKIAEAMELRLIGYSYPKIAEELGVDVSTAFRYVDEGMAQIIREPAEKVLQMELDRCDLIQSAFLPGATQGDLNAAAAVDRVMDRRARYLGLNKPTKVANTDAEGNFVATPNATPPVINVIFGQKPEPKKDDNPQG